jgi:spermidine/putrescine transport system permease protein
VPRRDGWRYLAPSGAWWLVFFALPIGSVAVVSLWSVASYTLIPGFSLHNYAKAFQPIYLGILLRTLRVAAMVTALAALIGYPVAYFLALRAKRSRVLLLTLIALPLWTSYLVRSFAWMLLLGSSGVVNWALLRLGVVARPVRWLLYSEFAVTVALVHIYIPFFVLPVYAVLEKLDRRLIEASRDLGASPWRTFRSVILPLSRPGIATGCLFVFIPAAGSYVTPELLGGPNAVMLGSVIAEQFGLVFQYPFGAALALVLMGCILAVAAAALRLGQVRT